MFARSLASKATPLSCSSRPLLFSSSSPSFSLNSSFLSLRQFHQSSAAMSNTKAFFDVQYAPVGTSSRMYSPPLLVYSGPKTAVGGVCPSICHPSIRPSQFDLFTDYYQPRRAALSSTSSRLTCPRLPATSVSSARLLRARATRAPASTASSPSLCSRVVTLPATM